MATSLPFDDAWLDQLTKNPDQEYNGTFSNNGDNLKYTAKIIIPNYSKNLETYFSKLIGSTLQSECDSIDFGVNFEHFGVSINFDEPLEVDLYNSDLKLQSGLCDIIARVGPISLKNVYFGSAIRDDGHRNRFPQFQFHIDRSAKQETRYSLYTRNPFDEEQKHPRTASTLFTSNISAYLQGVKQKLIQKNIDKCAPTSALLFETELMEEIMGKVVLEQRWDQPEGTGEIAIIDNATVLHASFYRDASQSGYRIGVRYLSGNNLPQ